MGRCLFAFSALALMLAVPAGAAESVRDVPGGAVATCLRDTGQAGVLSLQAAVTPASSPTDLLTTSPDKVERAAGTDLGALDNCPESASGGDIAVLAGFARGRVEGEPRFVDTVNVRAAVRLGDGDFGAPVTLDEIDAANADEIAVAAGASGDAVVAWREFRWRRVGLPTAVRVVASRRPAGADSAWTAPEEVVPWTRIEESHEGFAEYGETHVAAGVDGAGRTTVAWTLGAPPRGRGRIGNLSDVGVATAGRGGAFGAARVDSGVQDAGRPALAVAPDGRALLTVPTSFDVRIWERQPGTDAFAASPMSGETESGGPFEAAVALDPSGAALIAWRFGDTQDGGGGGIRAVRRRPGEEFGLPTLVWSRSGAGLGVFSLELFGPPLGPPEPPTDSVRLRVALSRTGRVAITWGDERRVFEDRLPSLLVASGALTGDFKVTRPGSPCRPINGATPFAQPGGDVAAAWTDNATESPEDQPVATGRLHVSGVSGAAPPAAVAPHAHIDPPRGTQRLWSADALEVNVGCDAPCDARVFLPSGGLPAGDRPILPGPLAAANTTFAAAGTKKVRLYPSSGPLAGIKPRTTAVLVHACSLDGTTRSRGKQRVRLVRPKPPRVPQPVRVRARRSGGDVVVTWRTQTRARRTHFIVVGSEARKGSLADAVLYETVPGRARRSFRVRLKRDPNVRVKWVTVTAFSSEDGEQEKVVRVPVAR